MSIQNCDNLIVIQKNKTNFIQKSNKIYPQSDKSDDKIALDEILYINFLFEWFCN